MNIVEMRGRGKVVTIMKIPDKSPPENYLISLLNLLKPHTGNHTERVKGILTSLNS
jgi:hypothetical protein